MKAAVVPVETSWLWTLAFGHHEDRTPDARLRGDTRGRDGGVRQKMAGVATANGGAASKGR